MGSAQIKAHPKKTTNQEDYIQDRQHFGTDLPAIEWNLASGKFARPIGGETEYPECNANNEGTCQIL